MSSCKECWVGQHAVCCGVLCCLVLAAQGLNGRGGLPLLFIPRFVPKLDNASFLGKTSQDKTSKEQACSTCVSFRFFAE